ncbi:MAG TPA: glutamate--tRNA ligase family protein, partial [Candidatus Acidoferrales bacterium]|nr:glutamate--tRNA ligase family protein [Candidatus Acidoferrales bacterium]
MTATFKPRVRFAPSPTGYLHVGGARTALFNWLFARHESGTFILRVEDTDVERNRPELVDGILKDLKWIGLDWDEGPYFQSQRLAIYRGAAEKLVASGAAYYCYCPPEKYGSGDFAEGEEVSQTKEGKDAAPRRVTRCNCRDARPTSGPQKPAIRFRVPLGAATQFEDAVFGHSEVSNEEIEDFVLLRSPKTEEQATGFPTYQLSAVVDDIEMRITHVIRGTDHLSNTPKQVLLYRAL